MDPTFAHSLVRLDAEQLFTVEGARGRGVVVFAGKVWITDTGLHTVTRHDVRPARSRADRGSRAGAPGDAGGRGRIARFDRL